MKVLLDTSVLGKLCHPRVEVNRPAAQWLQALLQVEPPVLVCVPEIADYELRRKLLHLISSGRVHAARSLVRLDEMAEELEYLPLTTAVMRRAAELWASARHGGRPTAAEGALDGDVILAAQALAVGGYVVTENDRHLSRFVRTARLKDMKAGASQEE